MSRDDRWAFLSPCERYRYVLWRRVAPGTRSVTFVLLNPTAADALVDDPTVSHCMKRASLWGFSTMEIVCLYAWRTNDPRQLCQIPDPVGLGNDSAIETSVRRSDLVVCGWGSGLADSNRVATVLRLIEASGRVPSALKLEADGSPAHPLILSYELAARPIAALRRTMQGVGT